MRYSEIKALINHLKSGRWAEVEFDSFIDSYFDITCLAHLKNMSFYGRVKSWRPL